MAKKIRGVLFEENENNAMGLSFYNLSHRFGYQSPNWPYFEDVKIERIHYMAKSGVLSQRITTSMHNTTHIDAPAHVVQGTPFIDEVPLPHFFGSGIVVSIPKKKWEPITYDDLEKAAGKVVRPRDVVIVNTGWHKKYEDSEDYFCYAPGFVSSAGEWFVEKKVKVVGHDTQANDHPLATAIGPQRNGPLHPHLAEEYKKWSGGRDWKDDFPEWEPVHRILFKNGILGIENVGGDIDKVTGRRCTFAFFPWNWDRGDGCIIRLVAIIDPKASLPDREGGEVLMQVKRFSEIKAYDAPNHRACSTLRVFGAEAGGTQEPDRRRVALPARRRRRAGRFAAREGLFRARGRIDGDRRRQGDGAEEARFLLHRPEREPRDRQPRQRECARSWSPSRRRRSRRQPAVPGMRERGSVPGHPPLAETSEGPCMPGTGAAGNDEEETPCPKTF